MHSENPQVLAARGARQGPEAAQLIVRQVTTGLRLSVALHALLPLAAAVAPSSAQNLSNHYVDGIRGRDLPGGGTAIDPWKTIAFAMTQMPAVTDPARWRTLVVEGDQVYSPASNGETLPIRPAYNVWIEGSFVGHGRMPVIRPAAGGTGLRYDPSVVYSRNQSTLRYLVFEGGAYGVAMGSSGDNRHRPRVQDCVFAGQTGAGARIDGGGPGRGIDPRFFQCAFTAARYGLEIVAENRGAVVFPDVEECTFTGITQFAIRLEDSSAGGNVGGTFRSNWFVSCTNGIWVNSHTGATTTNCRILTSSFQDIPDYAVLVVVNGPATAAAHIERTSFVRCETGVRIGGNLAGGRCDLTLTDSVAYACTSVGLRTDLDGAGSCSITMHDNLFESCAGAGAAFGNTTAEVALHVHSLRDRFLRNQSGLLLGRGASVDAVRIESAMICGSTSIGLNSLWPFVARGVTFADNGFGVLTLFAGNTATLDHCVFAGNATNVSGSPAISYSCFQGSAYPGIGNLNQTDPLLIRPLYKLAPDSPCIDRGSVAQPLPDTDYEGDPRASVGRRSGSAIPDLGADEYVWSGSVRRYGTPGFGRFNFFPRIGSPNSSVVAGGPLTVSLSGAILPVFGIPARDAFLTLGARDDPGGLPFDLGAFGAPGSMLWNEVHTVVGLVPVTPMGTASLTIAIPDAALLVGRSFTWQWFASQTSANPNAPVASDGLRVTVGQ